jgi:GAF domain-containing protein
MSTPQTPLSNQGQSLIERIKQTWQRLTEPHPSIKAIGEIRRAQLFSILTLIIGISFLGATFFSPRSFGMFVALGGITVASYALSRTKYYSLGIYIFTYAFTAAGFIRIYQGTSASIEASIASVVHISLILSSVLLSKRAFLPLVLMSTIATFTAPLYSNIPSPEASAIGSIGGTVFMIGAILYGIQFFRENLEKEALEEMSNTNRELENIKTNLEQRIEERALELEKANHQVKERAVRFQIISEISHEISSNVDQQPKELLDRITRLISEKLGFYHVSIFLLDENREFAVLRAANSQGGQHMLERRHQLKVGGTGIVGYVSQSGRPRIALDTGSDAVFFNNPDLPGTRSEIALPLMYGIKVIGVLDVQSILPSAFKDEDVNLLSTLANQIGIVVNTAMINERAGSGFSSQKVKTHGEQLNHKQKPGGYSFNTDGTISTASWVENPLLEQALATGEIITQDQPSKGNPSTLAVPVKFRDQVIGIIHVEAAEVSRKWTDDEITVVQSISERAAFALENARLFEETSRRAKQEETIARITSQIGASTDFDRILQTTVEELGRTLGSTRTFIQLSTSSENENNTPNNTVDN